MSSRSGKTVRRRRAPRRRWAAVSPEVLHSAMARTQRRVAEDHQVEQSEISCRCEQCFGARRDSETVYGLSWHRPWVPAYQEARALGISITDRHGGEDWVWDRLWEPPAAYLRGGERGECGPLGEH